MPMGTVPGLGLQERYWEVVCTPQAPNQSEKEDLKSLALVNILIIHHNTFTCSVAPQPRGSTQNPTA